MTNDLALSLIREAGKIQGDVLDMGAGSGYFTRLLSKEREQFGLKPGERLSACDIDAESFSAEGVSLKTCNVDEGLPFPDSSFDALAALEVLEHTRTPYSVLRDIRRLLRPGGVVVFSVPNVGNMLSRLVFTASGHYHMFPSPSEKVENAGRLCGHVAPLAYQYWHYGLRTAGFTDIRLHQDRTKRSAAMLTVLFWPILKLSTAMRLRSLAKKDPKLFEETAEIARTANGWKALTSRSLLFSARRV